MRKLFIGALMGVVALAMAGIAIGQGTGADDTVQEFELSFSTPKPSSSTGTDFHAAASSQSNPAGQPAPAREVDLGLGTAKANHRGAPVCRADDSDFGEEGEDACPAKSKVGEGVATSRVVINNTPADVTADVDAFNRKGGLDLYVQPRGGLGQPFVLHPKFTVEDGETHLITTVPPLCVPPGTFNASTNRCEANGAPSPNGEAVLIAFDLETFARPKNGTRVATTAKKKKRPIGLLKTPKRCPSSGEWEISGKFTYGDGSSKTLTSTTPCRRPR